MAVNQRTRLAAEEIEALVNSTETFRDELIIRLLAELGLRTSEVVRLRIPGFDLANHAMNVERLNKASRETIDLTIDLAADLERFIRSERHAYVDDTDSDYVFPSPNGDHMSRTVVNAIVDTAAEHAGIQETYQPRGFEPWEAKRFTPHALRYYAAQQLDNN